MYGCAIWTIRKTEHRRIDTLELERTGRTPVWSLELPTLGSPLDCKIKPVNPKGNQSWIFIGRTDTEAEAPILWPHDVKNWLLGKDPDAGNDWRQEKKGTTEDEMVGWQHRLNGHDFEQALGDTEGQGSLACCSPWGGKESDMTERLNNNNKDPQNLAQKLTSKSINNSGRTIKFGEVSN